MKKMLTRSVLIIIVALGGAMWTGATEVHAATGPLCYVGSGATVTPDGNSWASAWPSLQTALTDSNCEEIWVKSGVYRPGPSATQFFVHAGQQVFGGFEGNETLRTQRGPAAHITILSGDLGIDDVNTDGNQIAESVSDIVGDNSLNVVMIIGTETPVTNTTALDGFVVTAGDGADGGGLYCSGSGAGSECSPVLANLVFSGNRAAYQGGALFNNGRYGGLSSPQLSNVVFVGNRAGNQGGAIYNAGDAGRSSPRLVGALLQDNEAGADGGAIYNEGNNWGISTPIFEMVAFIQNSSTGGNGGAVFSDGRFGGVSSPGFYMVAFIDNSAMYGGGAVFNWGSEGQSSPVFTNVTFRGNSAQQGGGMYSVASSVDGPGTSSPTITNATFNDNNATAGGAMYAYERTGSTVAPALTNVIMWGDNALFGPEIDLVNAVPTYSHSIVDGSGGSGFWIPAFGTDLGGNLDVDPMLDPIHNNWAMPLLWGSPAIDAGSPSTCPAYDQRTIARPQGSGCDIGAYERIPPLARVDFDADGTSDVGVFRPSTTGWYVKDHLVTTYGLAGDVPVPGYYNADRLADVAVFRPSTAGWFVQGIGAAIYGLPGDVPVPADYNGDGGDEIAVYRPSTSAWYIRGMSATVYGVVGDIPVPGDYDRDGVADIAVYRPSTRGWYIKGISATIYGLAGDIPVPGDYDGNGTTDIAVFRPSTRGWYIRGLTATIYGLSGDVPVPSDYDGNGITEIAVYRPSTSGWYVKDVLATIYGLVGDYPLPAPDTNGDGDPYQ